MLALLIISLCLLSLVTIVNGVAFTVAILDSEPDLIPLFALSFGAGCFAIVVTALAIGYL